MIEKLEDLKSRAESLKYKDEKELDDIIRKTKMYVEKLFPLKFTYQSDIDSIKFKPSFYVSGMGDQPYRDSWSSGKQKLINFLDTRIEEKTIEQKPKTVSEPRIIEKIVTVQDNTRIDELTQENNALRKSKTLWNKINLGIFIPSLLTVLGGAFYLGNLIGNARFDTEKLEIFENNNLLEKKNDSLTKELDSANNKIQNLINLIPEDLTNIRLFPLKIDISFLSPSSIFEGEILITAKDEIGEKASLEFKGIKGVSESANGTFDTQTIKITKGDRFYLKSEKGNLYSLNVLSSSVDVELEIIEKK